MVGVNGVNTFSTNKTQNAELQKTRRLNQGKEEVTVTAC